MSHTSALRFGKFGGSDVHTSVELHRVGVYDFGQAAFASQ
jgi:hypothetical protein